MKRIVVPYDGSSFSDWLLSTLPGAGFGTEVEARVICAVDVWRRPSLAFEIPEFEVLQETEENVRVLKQHSEELAEKGASQIGQLCPGWKIMSQGELGSFSNIVVREAEHCGASVIVSGCDPSRLHDRSASSSLEIAAKAICSVRVVTTGTGENGKDTVLVEINPSSFGQDAVTECLSRQLAGKEVYLAGPQQSQSLLEAYQKRFAARAISATIHIFREKSSSDFGYLIDKLGTPTIMTNGRSFDQTGIKALISEMCIRRNCSLEVVRPTNGLR